MHGLEFGVDLVADNVQFCSTRIGLDGEIN